MTRNMGKIDRVVRGVVLGPVLVVVGLLVGPASLLSAALYAVAVIMFGTASLGFCPLYALFGVSTCPRNASGHHAASLTG